jgi:hypothetical protein
MSWLAVSVPTQAMLVRIWCRQASVASAAIRVDISASSAAICRSICSSRCRHYRVSKAMVMFFSRFLSGVGSRTRPSRALMSSAIWACGEVRAGLIGGCRLATNSLVGQQARQVLGYLLQASGATRLRCKPVPESPPLETRNPDRVPPSCRSRHTACPAARTTRTRSGLPFGALRRGALLLGFCSRDGPGMPDQENMPSMCSMRCAELMCHPPVSRSR